MKNPAIKIDDTLTVPFLALKATLSYHMIGSLATASKAAGGTMLNLAQPTDDILTAATIEWAAAWGMKAVEAYFHETTKGCFVVITESTGAEPISHWLKWSEEHGLFLDSEKPSDLPTSLDGDRIPVDGFIPDFMKGMPIELD